MASTWEPCYLSPLCFSGKNNVVWPGLNAPVVKGREVIRIKQLPPDPERESKIREIRDRGSQFRRFKIPALQRGWTGAKFAGTSIGPPDPVGDCKLELSCSAGCLVDWWVGWLTGWFVSWLVLFLYQVEDAITLW